MFGIREDFRVAYHSEVAAMRAWQKHLREDALTTMTLAQV
jgi:hypothetical protein